MNRQQRAYLRELYSHWYRCQHVYRIDNDGWYVNYASKPKVWRSLVALGFAEQQGPTRESFEVYYRITSAGISEMEKAKQ